MKRLTLLCASWLLSLLALTAADPNRNNQNTSGEGSSVSRALFGLDSVGANHRIQELVNPSIDAAGNATFTTNRVAILADGLNYLENGAWLETQTEFELQAGYASAVKGRHKVNIGGNVNVEGTVALRMPDNQSFRASVHGLAYYDSATGQSVLLSPLQDSQGYRTAPNRIIFTNAFANVNADIRYRLMRNGLEQDVIVKEQLPSPSQFGFSPETTRLEVWNEIFEAPEPTIRREKPVEPTDDMSGADDEYLEFGSMTIPPGYSFRVGHFDEPQGLVTVRKHWVNVDGRRFLVESVELPKVSSTLDQLPANTPGGASLRKPSPNRLQALQALPRKPRTDQLTPIQDAIGDPKVLAALERNSDGLVLDYIIKNTTTTETGAGFTFKANETYWVKDKFTIGPFSPTNSPLVFEGGTVIKFAKLNVGSNIYPGLDTDCLVDCQTAMYRPIVLTSEDNHTIGERLTTNSAPSGKYSNIALYLRSAGGSRQFNLKWLRMDRFNYALYIYGGTNHTIRHAQFVNNTYAIGSYIAGLAVYNGLFADNSFVYSSSSGTFSVKSHNVTVNNGWFGPDASPTFVNSILTGVPATNNASYTGTGSMSLTNTTVESSSVGVFATSFQGNYYLPAINSNRDTGTTAIDSQLAIDLRSLTTEAPIQLVAPTVDTTLGPRVTRDSDQPDRGYHYAPLDYFGTNIAINSITLTLANGVAVAGGYPGLFALSGTGSLVSTGRPENLNRLTTYQTVQEQDSYTITNASTPNLLFISGPNVTLRFTQVSLPAAPYTSRQLFSELQFNGPISVMDSEIRGAWWKVWNYAGWGVTPTVAITNSLVESSRFEFYQGFREVDQTANLPLTIRNCLFTRSELHLQRGHSSNGAWNIIDNLLDNSTGSLAYFTSNSAVELLGYNAYTTGTAFLAGSNNRVSMYRDFVTGPLGSNYYPTAGSGSSLATLVDQGYNGASTTAATIGLYYHSLLTDGSKEGTSRVDIGFHQVTVNSSGLPVDTDGDGIADLTEDSNGNGSVESGETNPTVSNTLGSGSNLLTVFTPLQ